MRLAFHNHCISADCLHLQKKRKAMRVNTAWQSPLFVPRLLKQLLYLTLCHQRCNMVSVYKCAQQRSRLNHLFMGIKDISLEMQVNANRLKICSGLLFICSSTFAPTLPFLLRGGGKQLLGFWSKTL